MGRRMNGRGVITGVGAVTPLGVGARTLYDGLMARPSGSLDGTGACRDFDPTDVMSTKEVRRSDRFAQLAIAACSEAIADAGWDETEPPCESDMVGCGM